MFKLIKNGTVVSSEAIATMDVLIENQIITLVKPGLDDKEIPPHTEIIDATGKLVLPGIIDAHTHYHLESRGTVTADSFFEGSRAAAYGGVTTVIDFSDHLPDCSFKEASQKRITAMSEAMVCDFALHQTVTSMKDEMRRELEELKRQGVTTIKIFTTYKKEGYLIDDSGLAELFAIAKDLQIMVTVHAEDDTIIDQATRQLTQELDRPLGRGLEESTRCLDRKLGADNGAANNSEKQTETGAIFHPGRHPDLRPAESEYAAVKKIGELADSQHTPVYIVHLSSQRGYTAVQELRKQGVVLMVETTPHYLLLERSLLEKEEGQKYIMTPPLRTKTDNKALWQGVYAGGIEIIATDHCAFTVEQKSLSNDCRTILPGIPGSEELFPLVYTYGVVQGEMDLQQLVSVLSAAPAKAFGIYPRKGVIAPGSDADIVIFDPQQNWTITDENRHSMAGYSPYSGMEVKGIVKHTLCRGEYIIKNGTFVGKPGAGIFLKAGTSSLYSA